MLPTAGNTDGNSRRRQPGGKGVLGAWGEPPQTVGHPGSLVLRMAVHFMIACLWATGSVHGLSASLRAGGGNLNTMSAPGWE